LNSGKQQSPASPSVSNRAQNETPPPPIRSRAFRSPHPKKNGLEQTGKEEKDGLWPYPVRDHQFWTRSLRHQLLPFFPSLLFNLFLTVIEQASFVSLTPCSIKEMNKEQKSQGGMKVASGKA
jgi:hypothetical protein